MGRGARGDRREPRRLVVAYAAGFYGRIELLERQKLVHISPKHLAWADAFFARHGDKAVFFGRMLPIVRTFISLPAGIARMPFKRFCVLTFLGALPWNSGLVLAGYAARDNWEDLQGLPALHRLRGRRRRSSRAPGTSPYRWWRNRRRGDAAPRMPPDRPATLPGRARARARRAARAGRAAPVSSSAHIALIP